VVIDGRGLLILFLAVVVIQLTAKAYFKSPGSASTSANNSVPGTVKIAPENESVDQYIRRMYPTRQ